MNIVEKQEVSSTYSTIWQPRFSTKRQWLPKCCYMNFKCFLLLRFFSSTDTFFLIWAHFLFFFCSYSYAYLYLVNCTTAVPLLLAVKQHDESSWGLSTFLSRRGERRTDSLLSFTFYLPATLTHTHVCRENQSRESRMLCRAEFVYQGPSVVILITVNTVLCFVRLHFKWICWSVFQSAVHKLNVFCAAGIGDFFFFFFFNQTALRV